jgi:uncharacterized protein (TIGR00661 family)
MKILFAIQGTGNGHVARAREVYPHLARWGQVDVLISGIQADVQLPVPLAYQLHGLSFIFGRRGGIDLFSTVRRSNLPRLLRDIRQLNVHRYDLVINDFEPVSAWACRFAKKACISLSHQAAVLHPLAPKPAVADAFGKLVLQRYAPVTDAYGFHFKAFGDKIYTPVIRSEIRELTPTDQRHYTVYLPAYDDETLVRHLSMFPGVQWQVFSKHNRQARTEGAVSISPVSNEAFVRSMAASTGVLCGAGFEGPAEALFLGKKLLVVPMKGQYEQQCNAAAAADLGVPVVPFLHPQSYPIIENWLKGNERVAVDYPDRTAEIIERVVTEHGPK